jgi:hypothetical protein
MKRVVTWLVVVLLAGAAGWWGWKRFRPPPAPVDLAQHDGQTIDFSSGQPVVRDSVGDKAALEKAAKEMAEATNGVTFEAPRKKPAPPPVEKK